jgi:hypothetical protein
VTVCAAFAGGFAAQLLLGCMTPEVADAGGNQVVRARAFVVVDEQGRDQVIVGSDGDCTGLVVKDGQAARLLIGMLPEEQVGLVINDAESATQVALGAWTETNHLDIYDGERRPRFTVGVNREAGNAGLSFYDPQKTARLSIGMGPSGGGDFVMNNYAGRDIWRASWNRREPTQ